VNAASPSRLPLPSPCRARPVVGILCCNERFDRPVQTVASRFVEPLARLTGATVLLVPAVTDACDVDAIAARLDGLLLSGSRSNVAPDRYGAATADGPFDRARDEVALRLAGGMIEAGRPVFGICRGLQELNVLFGGSLRALDGDHHHRGEESAFDDLFEHRHSVLLNPAGELARSTGSKMVIVNSVHRQAIDRLGVGLLAEAVAADDGVIEGFSAEVGVSRVLAVQWHPEWGVDSCALGQAFFRLFREALYRRQPEADIALM
jgi:putative glutamine amidotransferase